MTEEINRNMLCQLPAKRVLKRLLKFSIKSVIGKSHIKHSINSPQSTSCAHVAHKPFCKLSKHFNTVTVNNALQIFSRLGIP